MKHLGLVHILLLLGMGLLLGQAAAELTAYQNLIPSAEVGQMVTVTVSLTYNGQNSTQAVVAPSLPPGVVANAGGQSTELYPGITQQISYPLTAQQSGNYWIVSEISYAEDGTWRNLRLEAPFTATPSAMPQPQPMGSDPFAVPPGGVLPDGVSPHETQPGNRQPDNNETQPDSGFPGDGPHEGSNDGSGLGERPPGGL